jgi:integrase
MVQAQSEAIRLSVVSPSVSAALSRALGGVEFMSLSEAVKGWLKERQLEGLSVNEMKRVRTYCRFFLELVGDQKVDKINKSHARRFKEVLVSSGKSIATINNYLSRIRMLFDWLCNQYDNFSNPLAGMAVKEVKAPKDQRQAYTDEELRMLDSALVKLPRHKYWIILLARYMGLRQSEVCQLYRDDFKKVGGCWCLEVTDSRPDQRLKSSNSRRLLPVNQKLIDLGLMDYVSNGSDERLFSELTYSSAGNYSKHFGKWFSSWRKRYSLPEYHSLRHSVATKLKDEGVPEQYAAAILGHGSGGVTYGRYGKSVNVEKLKVVMDLIV